MTNSPYLWFKGSPELSADECQRCGKSVRDHVGVGMPTRTVTREELLKEYPMATNTPSKEEVAKAQEYYEQRYAEDQRCLICYNPRIKQAALEFAASYAAEQGRRIEHERDGLVVLLRAKCSDDEWVKLGELSKAARQYADAESRLTSLREGLRQLVQASERYMTRLDSEESATLAYEEFREEIHVATLLAEKKES